MLESQYAEEYLVVWNILATQMDRGEMNNTEESLHGHTETPLLFPFSLRFFMRTDVSSEGT